MKKRIIASQGIYDYFKVSKFIFLIEGSFSKNCINTYMKCNKIPFLWRNFFLKIASIGEYVYNFCNRPVNDFRRHCREWYLYNNTDGDDIRMLDFDMNNNYGAYW